METNRAKWGSSRLDPDGIGLRHLENFSPDNRRLELYTKVKRHNEYTAGIPPKECVQFVRDLQSWAKERGYSLEEVRQMKQDIRQ